MELLNAIELTRASRKHPQVGAWLTTWSIVAQAASWRSLMDVKVTYPSADGVPFGRGRNKLVVTVFNAGGNDYRLLTLINYSRQLIQIEAVLTHAEYSKNKWKKRYE